MKKRRLEADIDFDFDIIGLICPLKEYKLAWHINASLDIQLIKENDIEIEFIRNQNLQITNYLYQKEHSYLRMLKNRSITEFDENPAFLLPELNKFDFIILVQGFEDTLSINDLKSKLGSIPKVQYVQSFAVESLKSKENLIF